MCDGAWPDLPVLAAAAAGARCRLAGRERERERESRARCADPGQAPASPAADQGQTEGPILARARLARPGGSRGSNPAAGCSHGGSRVAQCPAPSIVPTALRERGMVTTVPLAPRTGQPGDFAPRQTSRRTDLRRGRHSAVASSLIDRLFPPRTPQRWRLSWNVLVLG